jgi:hypothetical protein
MRFVKKLRCVKNFLTVNDNESQKTRECDSFKLTKRITKRMKN